MSPIKHNTDKNMRQIDLLGNNNMMYQNQNSGFKNEEMNVLFNNYNKDDHHNRPERKSI